MEAYKALDKDNLLFIYDVLIQYWTEEGFDIEDWHVATLKLLPKKGDPQLPKNWRPICLLDILSKVNSSIIASRLDKYLIEEIGLQEQNGFSSARGCVDCTAALKIALQNLHSVNQEAYVVFVDLVKAFDSVNRTMLWKILAKYGVPETLITVIRKMYTGLSIECDVNGILFSFPSTSGVKQGDNLAPVLFLFAIQAALDSMSACWPFRQPEFEWCPKVAEDSNDTPDGTLTTRITAKKRLESFLLNKALFADDAAFIFLSREDLIAGTKHITEHFALFGLTVHLGTRSANGKEEKSKTEAMHFPIHNSESQPTDIANYDVLPHRFVSFCEVFQYLGSLITKDLNDSTDIKARIGKAYGAWHQMKPILLNKKLPRKLRGTLYVSTVLNVLLWGVDSWALSALHRTKLQSCHNRFVRGMNHMSLWHCQHYRRSMIEMHESLGINQMRGTIVLRQLRFLERVARLGGHRLTRKMIGAQAVKEADTKSLKGARTTTQSGFRMSLEEAGMSKPKSGGQFEWMVNLRMKNAGVKIDQALSLIPGTYDKGRKEPREMKTYGTIM